jgi:putative hydrolase of the HAD superfamily
MIRAITFDLWGTLILNSEEYAHSLRRTREELLYEALKGTISREFLVGALDQSWSEIQIVRSTLRDVPTSEQIRILTTLLKTDNDLEKPYTEAVLHFSPAINPHAKEVLKQIQLKVGLISNTGRTPGTVLRSVLSNLEILEFFTVLLFSNEVGYLKPHPEIFRRASQELEVPLSQILHVGDDVKADVEGARHAGMKTLLIEEPSDLLKVTELIT